MTVFPVPTIGVSKAAVMLAGSMDTESPLIAVMLAEVTAALVVPSKALFPTTTEAVTGLGSAVKVHWPETGR